MAAPFVGIIMGSANDFETMRHAAEMLERFGVPHEVEGRLGPPHPRGDVRTTPRRRPARGLKLIIAGRGRRGPPARHGRLAHPAAGAGRAGAVEGALGRRLLLSIVQMPAGVPTATFAIGPSGATNAALFAVRLLALSDASLAKQLAAHRQEALRRVGRLHRADQRHRAFGQAARPGAGQEEMTGRSASSAAGSWG